MSIFEHSLLRNHHLLVVESHPFPHVVIKDAISYDHADLLTSEFPIKTFNLKKNNYRYDISANDLSNFPDISMDWNDFINFHCSKDFFLQFAYLFKEYLPFKDMQKKKYRSI